MKNAFALSFACLVCVLGCLPPLSAEEVFRKRDITLEELEQSSAAKLFQLGGYDRALKEFEKLQKEYPDDLLIKRYIGMTLTLLGRLDDAADVLKAVVKRDPHNPAGYYFLARVYHEQGRSKEAADALHEVIRLDPEGFYGRPAREALPLVAHKKLVEKPWDIWASAGYEYDSNVTIAPNDTALRGLNAQDESAGRYYFTVGGKYKWLKLARFDSTVGYRLYRSFHDDSLDEFNYTYQQWDIGIEYRPLIKEKEVKFGLRYQLPLGFLGGNLFIFANEAVAYINSRLTKNTFTEIYHKYSHFEFGPDGRIPDQLSRDGEYNVSGIHHRYYFSNFSRYVFAGYEIFSGATEGNSFDHVGHVAQVGFHTPLVGELTLDTIGSFTVANYTHYSAEIAPIEPVARLNHDWSFLIRLTYPLGRHWQLRAFYRYINANNRNDIFQYDRQIGGTEVVFRY